MTGSRRRFLWWFLLTTAIVSFCVVFLLSARTRYSLPPGWGWLMWAAVTVGAVGAVVAHRRPQAPIGWIFLFVLWLAGVGALASAIAELAAESGDRSIFVALCAAFATVYWPPQFLLATTFTVLLFPDGVASSRWRPVLWVAIAATAVIAVAPLLGPTFDLADGDGAPTIANPLAGLFGGGSQGLSDAVLATAGLIGFACGLVGLLGILIRTFRSKGVLHLQLRWFTSALVVVALAQFIHWDSANGANPFLAIAISLIPISCGVAILRYHLYDIDRIVSRTTSYAIVTGLLLATYFAVIGLATSVMGKESPLAVAGATLTAAALARPALRSVQSLVDRRFNRARYDALHTVDAFGARLRNQVDPGQVSEDLVGVVNTTLQPDRVALWVKVTR